MAKTPELDVRDNYLQNYVINGNFDFWQRGTSFSIATGGSYACDRWKQGRDGSGDVGTLNRQAFALGQTSVPGEPTYYLQYNQTTAGTGTTVRALEHRIESVRTLAGKTITVSFYMQADTNRTVGVFTQQVFGTGGSPSSLVNTTTQNITVTSSWQKFSLTFNIASIAGKTLGTDNNDFLSIVFTLPLNAVMTINLARVQVNEGSEAAPFRLSGGTVAGELIACQRYFNKSMPLATPATSNTGDRRGAVVHLATITGPITFQFTISYPVSMRTNPSLTFYGVHQANSNFSNFSASNDGGTGVSLNANPGDKYFTFGNSGSFNTSGVLMGIHWSADAEL